MGNEKRPLQLTVHYVVTKSDEIKRLGEAVAKIFGFGANTLII